MLREKSKQMFLKDQKAYWEKWKAAKEIQTAKAVIIGPNEVG